MKIYDKFSFEEALESGEFTADGVSVADEIKAAELRQDTTPEAFLGTMEMSQLDPSSTESAETTSSYMLRFESFVRDLGVRHFAAHEFLALGGSNAAGGRCSGMNFFPPSELWPTIAATAQFADAIRSRLGSAIVVLSAYRSENYNGCIGGASRSQHKLFGALDIAPRATSVSETWQVARDIRASNSRFTGGIGKYNSFVHIDTRGWNADWVG